MLAVSGFGPCRGIHGGRLYIKPRGWPWSQHEEVRADQAVVPDGRSAVIGDDDLLGLLPGVNTRRDHRVPVTFAGRYETGGTGRRPTSRRACRGVDDWLCELKPYLPGDKLEARRGPRRTESES
jgi:hypothetical protein